MEAPLPPEARILLASDPSTYTEVLRRRKRARDAMEGASGAEVTRRMYPAIASAGGRVQVDLAAHLRGAREPVASRDASSEGGSVSVALGHDSTWFACQDFYTDEFRVRSILAGGPHDANLPAVRGAPSWSPAVAEGGGPAILFGLSDGCVALWARGRFRVLPPGDDGRGAAPRECDGTHAAYGTGPMRVRRIAPLGPGRAVAAVGSLETLVLVDLKTGAREELWRNPRAWLVDLAHEAGLVWAEYTTGVLTLREGGEPTLRAPWPRLGPSADAEPWSAGPFAWCPSRYALFCGDGAVLHDVTSVRFLRPVGEGRVFVATQRGAFLWEPLTRRVLAIVSDGRPGTWCAPGREAYLCDRSFAHYALGLEAGPDAWRPYLVRERRWAERPEPLLETLARADLFSRHAVHAGTHAYLSPSRRRVAFYRRPEDRGRFATVTVARTEEGALDGPYRVPYRAEGRIVVARGVRFTGDENAVAVPTAVGFSLFLLGGRPIEVVPSG